MRYLQNLLMLIVLFIALGAAVFYAFNEIDKPAWIETQAEVINSSSFDKFPYLFRKYPRDYNTYVINVDYRYVVNTKYYQGHDSIELLRNDQPFNDSSRYSRGKIIRIKYNANNPEDSSIMDAANVEAYQYLIFGFGIFLVMLIALLMRIFSR